MPELTTDRTQRQTGLETTPNVVNVDRAARCPRCAEPVSSSCGDHRAAMYADLGGDVVDRPTSVELRTQPLRVVKARIPNWRQQPTNSAVATDTTHRSIRILNRVRESTISPIIEPGLERRTITLTGQRVDNLAPVLIRSRLRL